MLVLLHPLDTVHLADFLVERGRSSVTDLGLGEPLGLVEVFEVVVGFLVDECAIALP